MAAKDYMAQRRQWNIDHGYPVDAPATYGSTGGPGLLRDVSQVATDIYQPIEKTVSQNLAVLDKDLSLSQNAPLLAAMALSVAAPGVGSAIGQQMIAAGLLPAATSAAVATAIGTGVANAALQVAQGKSAEDALKSVVVGGVAGFAGGRGGSSSSSTTTSSSSGRVGSRKRRRRKMMHYMS